MTYEEFLKEWPPLAKDYHPSPEVLKRISNVTLCMIVGPSGVGKSTLIERSGFSFVPSDTSREPRPGEQEGVDMFFRQDYEQVIADIKAGRFVQIAPFATGNLYSTKNTSYPESGVGIMPVMANVIPIFRHLGFKETISAFITPPSYEEWMRRLAAHHSNSELLHKRLTEARDSFEFALHDDQTHFVLNDEVETAVAQLKNLVGGELDDLREQKARQIAQTLLAQLPLAA